jgi:hypothetical protein
MNIRKKTFAVLVAIIGCLIANFNSELAAAPRRHRSDPNDILNQVENLRIHGDEMVSPIEITNTLLANVLSSPMTNVKGCLADPFVYAVYGHGRNDILAERGRKNDMYGFVLGADNVWTFANEKYFRLGAALGYVHGRTTSSDDDHYTHNIYATKLFGAYESFNDKCLKTNIGVILGYNFGKDKLGVDNPDIEIMSHSISLGVEFIKNLYAYNGYQFGPWLKANYSFILQHVSSDGKRMYPDPISHDFLATVLGLNMEKEIFERTDRKLTLSLKAGWECRVMQRVTAILPFLFGDDTYVALGVSYPVRNSTVLSFRASQKLNTHWSIVGSYSARFNGNASLHGLSGGIEYAF